MTTPTQQDVLNAIAQAANETGVPYNLALAIAQHESGLDPMAIGDQGTSFGLYQLHKGGELGSMSQQQAWDPLTNARRALAQVANVMHAHPNWSWGQIAAGAQRPADPGAYASAIDKATSTQQSGGLSPEQYADTSPGGNADVIASQQPLPLAGVTNTPIDLRQFAAQNGIPPAWVNDPELGPLLEQWDNQQISDAQFYAKAQQTTLWKTTPQAVRTELALQATDPSTLQQSINNDATHVSTLAQRMGVPLTPQQATQVATDAYLGNYRGNDERLQQVLAKYLVYKPGQNMTGAASSQAALLQQYYTDYALPVSDQRIGQQLQNVLAGTQTTDDIKAQLQQQAITVYASNPQLTQYLQQGHTVQEWADPYKQKAASLLGINPDSVNLSAPMWSQVLKPAADPKTGQSSGQAMSLDQWETKLRTDPTYGYDTSLNAIQSASQLANGLKQTLGFGAA